MMPVEPTMQVPTTVCEVPPARTAQGCPVCGGGLVPLRGQWRCARCLFSLCVGCEQPSGEPAGDGD